MDRFWKIIVKVANGAGGGSSPFVGRGKLDNYKDKDDSWILNQMKTRRTNPGIKLVNDENGQIKFKGAE